MKRILVTGASGYIGGKLIPLLLERGYPVRCLVRNGESLRNRSWSGEIEIIEGDLTRPQSLVPALEGVWTAYYLVHNMTSGRHYPERDLQAARNFCAAAGKAALEHVIYLGGLADPQARLSAHMRSRIQTGQVLRAGCVQVTEFRAGVIVGPGSISFEMIRYLTEQLPILAGPSWLRNRAQPIAAENVLAYLLAALDEPGTSGRVYEIGGRQVLSYAETMLVYARERGLHRQLFTLPGLPVWLMALLVERLTPVPAAIARPLIEGLQADSLVREPSARQAFPGVELLDYDRAVQRALADLSPAHVDLVIHPGRSARSFRQDGFLLEVRQILLAAAPGQVLDACAWLARRTGLELLQPVHPPANRCLARYPQQRSGGQGWLEWRALAEADLTRLVQIAWFAPRGLSGFLYWTLCAPLRRLDTARHFRVLRHLTRRSTAQDSLV